MLKGSTNGRFTESVDEKMTYPKFTYLDKMYEEDYEENHLLPPKAFWLQLFICYKLKCKEQRYIGDKPDPESWADLITDDEDFREEFICLYDNMEIKEADDYIPEVLEDTYLNMELALLRDGEGPEFAKVKRQLLDANGITN